MPTTQQSPTASPIGRDTPRVDGPQKVSGRAQYTSDFHFPGLLYAVPVGATIANGKRQAGKFMPAWKGQLNDQQISQITAFILSLRDQQ